MLKFYIKVSHVKGNTLTPGSYPAEIQVLFICGLFNFYPIPFMELALGLDSEQFSY